MTVAVSYVSARITQFGRTILVGLFALFFFAALLPEVRSSIRGSVLKDYRMVISTVQGDLAGNGKELTVAKVRTREAIYLEIYVPKEDGSQKLLERIELPDKKDGFFNFNGQATNLAIDDIDGDGQKEIIVPSFDQNMVGHLNIYRFEQATGAFQRSML